MSEHGIIHSSGEFGANWPANNVLSQGKNGSLSSAGWTEGNEGFPQQTFLGASIRSFNINAGFGNSTSTLAVELVNDTYHGSDGTKLGEGDDPYHNGKEDEFQPPVVGTPVYFKFGKNYATVEQAYRKTFDDLYNTSTISDQDNFPTKTTKGEITYVPEGHYLRSSKGEGTSQVNTWVDKSSLLDSTNTSRGKNHFVFGGILQSYTQNRSAAGNPLYSVGVTDPREILSNATVLFNNYQGTTFNNKNLFNVYGFLEYDISNSLRGFLDTYASSKNVLTKQVDAVGNVFYVGDDTYRSLQLPYTVDILPPIFPVTGQGFSRRSEKGIPWYRVYQGIKALFNYDGYLPQEYINAGFGGTIDFRGFKYVVDFSGIPLELIPQMYHLDFDQLDMLSLAQELCDVISHDLYVTLLPVIDHPGSKFLYEHNKNQIERGNSQNIITGIIRVDAINKSLPPKYGAIKAYIDNLQERGIDVQNQDVGFELSNVTTDKFVVGAQEVEMYYFSNNTDRDNLELRKKNSGRPNDYELLQKDQWSLETSLNQQILPFYGFLGDKAVTIPRGFGSYQQIMLDATNLDAHGVGNYYIATEMELRAALVSYDQWKNFLLQYDEVYIQELSNNQAFYSSLSSTIDKVVDGVNNQLDEDSPIKEQLNSLKGREFGVSVPRCVFNSDKNYMGPDGYPASPCSPPYGYPLYFKRAEKIGIPEAGIVSVQNAIVSSISNVDRLTKKIDKNSEYFKLRADNAKKQLNKVQTKIDVEWSIFAKSRGDSKKAHEEFLEIRYIKELYEAKNEAAEYLKNIDKELKDENKIDKSMIQATRYNLEGNKRLVKNSSRYAKEHLKNARKVYAFVKKVADDNLGKKFLVKIPKVCNSSYNKLITGNQTTKEITTGPFGFRPIPVGTNAGDIYGALRCNFNPISENWEFNYKPEPQGGFFNFALYNRNLSAIESSFVPNSQLPLATQQMLAPMDLTNFLNGGNRVSCYARYDNSQFLDFHNVGKNMIAQQSITAGGFVPDIMEDLPNLSPDASLSMDQIQARLTDDQFLERQGPSVAYVRCEISEDLYMPPLIGVGSTKVWATDYTVNIPTSFPVEILDESQPYWGDDSCYKPNPPWYNPRNYDTSCPRPRIAKRRLIPSFSVPKGGAPGGSVSNTDFLRYHDTTMKGDIVDTRLLNLDSNNVYALITVPGRIIPSVDSRYLDGPLHSFNTVKLKNILTQDVVRGPAGFHRPAPITNKKAEVDCDTSIFSFRAISEALQHQRDIVKGVSLSSPEGLLSFTSPSPVYPDLVALPLMSMERCYGPWLSSSIINPAGDPRIRYSDIGGKVEFVKKETLAPWNFGGFQLMNEAGSLEAQFSNSLLLFSERGGFVFPDAPTGIAVARALQKEGPLVTSVSVSVGESVKTTVKMDLYTSSFGKLQKQKEGAIATIARERQKIIDQNNNAIRRGLGKASSNNNLFGGLLANGGQRIIDTARAGEIHFTEFEKQQHKAADLITFSAVSQDYVNLGDLPVNDPVGSLRTSRRDNLNQGIVQSSDRFQEVNGVISTDGIRAENKHLKTAGGYIYDFGTAYCEGVATPGNAFPCTRYENKDALTYKTRYT
jgi:hypothetical protein